MAGIRGLYGLDGRKQQGIWNASSPVGQNNMERTNPNTMAARIWNTVPSGIKRPSIPRLRLDLGMSAPGFGGGLQQPRASDIRPDREDVDFAAKEMELEKERAKWTGNGEYARGIRENGWGGGSPAGGGIWNGDTGEASARPGFRFTRDYGSEPWAEADTGMKVGSPEAAAHAAALAQHRHGDVYGLVRAADMLPARSRGPGWEPAFGGSQFMRRKSKQERMWDAKNKSEEAITNAKGMWENTKAGTEGMWNVKGIEQQGQNDLSVAKAKTLGDLKLEKVKGNNATALQGLVNSGALDLENVKGDNAVKLQELLNSGAIDLSKANGANAIALQQWINGGLVDIEKIKGENQQLYQQLVNSGMVDVAKIQGAAQVDVAGINAASAGATAAAAREAQERPSLLAGSGALAGSPYRLGENNTVIGPDGKPVSFNDKGLRETGKERFRRVYGFDDGTIRQLHQGEIVVGLANENGQMVPRTAAPGSSVAAGLITDYNQIARYDAALAAFLKNDTPKPRAPIDSLLAS